MSVYDHHLNKLCGLSPRCYITIFSLNAILVLEQKIFKDFTIYGHSGNLIKWTVTICINFQSPFDRSLKKIDPGVSEEKSFKGRRTDGRRSASDQNSSSLAYCDEREVKAHPNTEQEKRIWTVNWRATACFSLGFLLAFILALTSDVVLWLSTEIFQLNNAGLGSSVRCAVRLETRRSRVQPPPRSATFFRGDWSWNIFYGNSFPSADSRRAVVSFWRKNVHNTG